MLAPTTAYLRTLVIPASQYVESAMLRAFSASGRFSALSPAMTEKWQGGYAYRPFDVITTSQEFEWSRRSGQPGQKLVATNVAAMYTPYMHQSLIAGVIQGRKQFDPQAASVICRRNMWQAVVSIAMNLPTPQLLGLVTIETYAKLKADPLLHERRRVKDDVKAAVLKGWVRNEGDDQFTLLVDGGGRERRVEVSSELGKNLS